MWRIYCTSEPLTLSPYNNARSIRNCVVTDLFRMIFTYAFAAAARPTLRPFGHAAQSSEKPGSGSIGRWPPKRSINQRPE